MLMPNYLLLFLLLKPMWGLILPLTKPNGDPDINSLINHITLMEQKIAALETEDKTYNSELSTVKGQLKTTLDQLSTVQAELSSAKTDIAVLKRDLQKSPDPVEFAMLKSQLEALKGNHNVTMQQSSLKALESISSDVKSNVKEIQSVKSQLLSTQTELQTTNQDVRTVTDELSNITSQMVDMNQDIDEAVHQVDRNMRQVSALTLQVQDMQKTSNSTSRDVQLIENQLNGLQTVTNSSQGFIFVKNTMDVAFQATQRNGNYDGPQTLMFNQVDYNAGGGYNNISGIFAAPVSGTYIFWAKVNFVDNNFMYNIYLLDNTNKVLGQGYVKLQSEPNPYDVRLASIMTVTHLDKGGEVHFSTDQTADKILGYGSSSYGGALIHAA